MTKVYRGKRAGYGGSPQVIVVEGNAWRDLDPRFDLRKHSPTGFEWGYQGSGPAQLALAIVADACGAEIAQRVYQEFKSSQVATIGGDEWTVSVDDVKAEVARLQGNP